MNGPGPVQLHAPVRGIATNLVLMPDEPAFNYVNRVLALSCRMDRRAIVGELFGSTGLKVDSPLHGGFAHFAQQFGGAQPSCAHMLAETHSMLGLYRSFLTPERYEQGLRIASSQRANGLNLQVGASVARDFRPSPAQCVNAGQEPRLFDASQGP